MGNGVDRIEHAARAGRPESFPPGALPLDMDDARVRDLVFAAVRLGGREVGVDQDIEGRVLESDGCLLIYAWEGLA